MLMSHDEFDRMLVKYLSEATRKNIKEILDTVRVKVMNKCRDYVVMEKDYFRFRNGNN